VTRRHLNYIARALIFSKELRPEMASERIGEVFRGWTHARAAALGLPRDELTELDAWLAPGTESHD